MKHTKVAVIGAGIAGICAGILLKRDTDFDFLILEKEKEIGGTWRDNTYPGVECDVPSHLYSFSFELNPDWSRDYPSGPEILDYLSGVVDKYELRQRLMLGAHVLRAEYTDGAWIITLATGEQIRAEAIISALGILHVPKVPNWPGLDTFVGPAFHTALWRHDVDLVGKRVGMIGTGATSVQASPKIAEIAEKLVVFQRSPVWVGPKENAPIPEEQRQRLREHPAELRRKRWELWRSWESTGKEMVTPNSSLNRRAHENVQRHLRSQVENPAMAERLTPEYNYSCKRPTLSNDYYRMFNRPNVELVTNGIARVKADGVTTADGRFILLDVLVYATGFNSVDITAELDVIGEDGTALREVWSKGNISYRSMMAPKMPNLFMIFGPNSAGLTSAYQVIEAGCHFAVRALKWMHETGCTKMTPRMEAAIAFSEEMQSLCSKTTINRGCASWYTNGTGYNHANWPLSSVEYRMMLNEFAPQHFEFA